jgi:tryptophan synthase alpha chain
MTNIATAFSRLDHPAFIPFFTAGDPDLDTTAWLVKDAAGRGADLIELGVPFSDPIADGPTIQASYHRALEKGFRVQQFFDLVERLRADGLRLPLVGMVSQTLVFRRGPEKFLAEARRAGVDGLIVPDLPAGYEGDFAKQAAQADLDLIFLCAPTTPPRRRALIARLASGFLYYVSVTGITGARAGLPEDLEANVRELKGLTGTPVCVGFGVSGPEQAAAVARFADGVIVGSALVRRVDELFNQGLSPRKMLAVFGEDLAALANAVHEARTIDD